MIEKKLKKWKMKAMVPVIVEAPGDVFWFLNQKRHQRSLSGPLSSGRARAKNPRTLRLLVENSRLRMIHNPHHAEMRKIFLT